MEVIIAMGHFCDTHGPCVILCTQVFDEIPADEQSVSKIPICSACESISLDTVFTCEDENKYYVTSRNPLDSNISQLLKDAVLRSLSIEMVLQDGKNSGTMYFGDNNRGHIISHVFSIKDSFARGFKRKYCIIILGKHQISLLSHYSFVEKNLKQISEDLQKKSEKFNTTERSSTTNVEKVLRCLPQLVGERNIFAQLHMWFVFLLSAKIFHIIPHNIPTCPVSCPYIEKLRNIKMELPNTVYDTITYCILTGIQLEETNVDILKCFQQLLPKGFQLPKTGKKYCVSKIKDKWDINFNESLPSILPTLQVSIQEALEDTKITQAALQTFITSLIMHWFNISCVLSWTTKSCENLVRTLEVRKCDMPLLNYWIPQSNKCVVYCKTDYFKPTIIVDK